MSYQERQAGSQTPLLYTLSLMIVFLCLAELEALERALHAPTVRAGREQLAALLDEEFSEIGSSGRCYDRAAALEEIPLERAQVQIESEQYA
ncbi:DUF4440 domain-containing protein, partial [Enterococcus faecalis]|nr:DUF4440 domain-containing protein [Enterococcus faecalis]